MQLHRPVMLKLERWRRGFSRWFWSIPAIVFALAGFLFAFYVKGMALGTGFSGIFTAYLEYAHRIKNSFAAFH